MQVVFKRELDKIELENIKKFCNSVDYCSIEQSVGWSQLFYKSKICYFYLFDEYGIKSFSQINEGVKSAQIYFGPVCCEKEVMITSINEIIHYYKKRGFYYLGIQMYYKSGYDTDYIEYALNKLHKIKYIFNNENTKSSIEINLDDTQEEIFKKFKENHKRNIKKALNLKMTVEVMKDAFELASFVKIYLKMSKVRSLDEDKPINQIYNFLINNKKGEVLLIKDKDNIILGGAILAYQGNTVRYLIGATDPDRYDLPMLHLVLYKAIIKAKNNNFKYFDFWGFDHFADENDQVFNINKFKKGFGGYYTFFAKKMNINLIPYGYVFYKFLLIIKKIYWRISIIL